ALQMSLRFEKLMAEQRALESSAALNDQELLYSIIERYNNFRGVVTDEMLNQLIDTFKSGAYLIAVMLFKEQLNAAKYSVDCVALSHDYREAVAYNLKKNKLESNQHVTKVLHMKAQLDVGLSIAEKFMDRRLLVVCGERTQNVATLQRRILQDAKSKGFETSIEQMHHLGYIDLSKIGRLSAPDVQEVSDWTYKDKLCSNHMEMKTVQVLYEMMDELSKECYLCGFSETTNPVVHTYACTQIKDKLIEDWKSGSGCIGSWTPRFNPEPDQSTNLQPQVPTMKVCKMENDVPVIPKEVRERWLNDPVRNPDWRVRLKNFDAVFAAPSDPGTSAPRPRPDPSAQDVDLGADKPTPPQEGGSATTDSHAPASMTVEAFKQKFPTVTATVAINLGQTVTAYLVENQVYIMCAVKHRIVGAESREAKCIFPYGGGQWISDGAKAGTLAKVD
ncbi:Uncharacterized protein SCF082_LOCUS3226, partial [Durusdinium trenchii]